MPQNNPVIILDRGNEINNSIGFGIERTKITTGKINRDRKLKRTQLFSHAQFLFTFIGSANMPFSVPATNASRIPN